MRETHQKIIILGSGPAGYTAAIYAARANLRPVLITGSNPGGQLITTEKIDNWPGEQDGISGIDFMLKLKKQAMRFNTKIIHDHIISANCQSPPFVLNSADHKYTCDSLIIATGSDAKYIGLESEKKFLGKGVSSCATCDGFFYKDRDVAVVGGGNTAVEETLYLANIARSVTLIHRRDRLRAEKILVEQLRRKSEEKNIRIMWNHEVKEILGNEKGVDAIKVQNNKNNKDEKIKVHGLFVAIGHAPNTSLFKNQLTMNKGYIVVQSGLLGNYTQTSKEGIYAAGDVVDNVYQQAITAAGSGCMAALDSEKYLDRKLLS